MRIFHHTIAAVCALLFAAPCFAQVTQLRQVSATSTQIVIGWDYSPASADCTVAAALDNGSGSNLTPLAFDVDPSKFANSNDQQLRYPSLQLGSYRTFVIGTPTVPSDPYPATASNGLNYSRALEQESLYNVQVTCGSSSATIQAHTAQLAPGISYHFPYPIAAGGSYAYPTPNLTMGSTEIDPSTGILLTQVTAPGLQEQSTTQQFDAVGTCANWTNPSNMYAADGNYATYSQTASDKCTVMFGGSAGLTTFQYGVGNFQFDGYQLAVKGYGTSGSEQISICFTFNGTSCAAGATTQTITLPSLTPSTQTIPATITPIDTTWLPWQYYEGATTGSGVTSNANFGVLIWKTGSDTNQINIDQVEMTLKYSQPFLSANGGEDIPCSSKYVQDGNGINGVLCYVGTIGGFGNMFWLADPQSATSTPVRYFGLSSEPSGKVIGGATFSSLGFGGYPMASDVTPTNLFGLGTDTSGNLHFVECELPASGSNTWNTGFSSGYACDNLGGTLVDLTPSSSGYLWDPSSASNSLIDEFAQAFPGEGSIPTGCTAIPTNNYPCFPDSSFSTGNFSVQNVQGNYAVIAIRKVQNDAGWLVVVNAGASPATVVGMTNTFSNLVARGASIHTAHPTGNTNWVEETFDNLDGGTDGSGPYAVTLEVNMSSSQPYACVDTNTPSESEAGVPDPLFNELAPLQAGDNIVIDGEEMTVTGAPESPGTNCTAGQWDLPVARGVFATTAAAHSSGALAYWHFYGDAYGNSGNNGQKVYWNFVNDPYGDLNGSQTATFFVGSFWNPNGPTPAYCTYKTYSGNSNGCSTTNGYLYFSDHDSWLNGYQIGESYYGESGLAFPGAVPLPSFLNLQVPFGSMHSGYFGGTGESSQFEPHPAAPQGIQSPSNEGFNATDELTLNVSNPFGTSSNTSSAPCNGALQSLGSNIYRCPASSFSAISGYALNYYGPVVMAFAGVQPLVDVSGPNSTTGINTSYTFCVAHSAGECYSGSSIGDIYFDIPNAGVSSCGFSSTGGAQALSYYGNGCPYVGQLPMMIDGVQETALLNENASNGTLFRDLTGCLNPFGRNNGLATAHTFGANRYAICDATDYGTENGVRVPREDLWLAQIPSWKTVSTPAYDFNWIPVTIPAPPASFGASTAELDFGYNTNFYCTSRQDSCAAVNTTVTTATPFKFTSGDAGYARPSCSSGCTIYVPVIPDRLAYYQVKFYSSAGAQVGNGASGII